MISVVGFLLALILSLLLWERWNVLITTEQDSFKVSFLASLFEDIIFFGLVGLAIGVAQFTASKGDTLQARLAKLFANRNFDLGVLSYFETTIRKNAVYSENSAHEIVITHYEPELHAYRLIFHNQYELHNLFGDVPYSADLSVEIAPDLVRNDIDKLGEVSLLRTTPEDGQPTDWIKHTTTLGKEGFSKELELSLKPNQKLKYEMKWWSFASNIGKSGFSVKRFSRKFIVDIKNISRYSVRIRYGEKLDKVAVLGYDQSIRIADFKNVPEKTRLDFEWLPPEEHDEKDPHNVSSDEHDILDFDRRLGDKEKNEI
ncbi:MAG: hypothetical protein DHS20C05_02640 [Hyphococcus sp.]|nr:MAG: hypothetical protein DHS20C05_02640 [Marinicaulis sp.]